MKSESPNITRLSERGGMEEVTVIVNREGSHRRKRFVGQILVKWLQPTPDEEGTEVLTVYITAQKQYALHTRTVPEWDVSEGDPDIWGNPANWGVKNTFLAGIMGFGWDWEVFKESGHYTLEVFKTLEELKSHVPSDLFKAVSQAADGPEIETLDI